MALVTANHFWSFICQALSSAFPVFLPVAQCPLKKSFSPSVSQICLLLETKNLGKSRSLSLSFLIAQTTEWNFMISQVPSSSTNFRSCNHKISDKPTKTLRI